MYERGCLQERCNEVTKHEGGEESVLVGLVPEVQRHNEAEEYNQRDVETSSQLQKCESDHYVRPLCKVFKLRSSYTCAEKQR